MRNGRLLLCLLAAAVALAADQPLPPELRGVGVDEHLGQSVDLNLTFTGEDGYAVPLRSLFHQGRPVLLDLVYCSCPMLCTLVLNGQTAALKNVPWTPGNEFEVVTISIDPTDTFDLAQRKRASYLESYGRPAAGWHFLTDDHGNAKRLAEQLGFRYRYDESQKQYADPAPVAPATARRTSGILTVWKSRGRSFRWPS